MASREGEILFGFSLDRALTCAASLVHTVSGALLALGRRCDVLASTTVSRVVQ